MRRALENVVKKSAQILSRFSLGGSLSVQDTAEENEDSHSLPDVVKQEETHGIEYRVSSSVGEEMTSSSSELQLSSDDLNSMSYEHVKITDMNVKDLKAALVKEGFKPPNSFNKKQCVEKLGQLVVEKQLQENRTKGAAMTASQSSSASSGTKQSSQAKRTNKPQEVAAGSVSATTASSTRSTRTRGSSKKGSTAESTIAVEDDENDDTEELSEHATAMDVDESKSSKTKSVRGRSKKVGGEIVAETAPAITTTSARSSHTNSKMSVEGENDDGSSMAIPAAAVATTMAAGGRGSRSKKTIADGLAPEAAAVPAASITGKRTRGKANHEEEEEPAAALVATGRAGEAASRGSRKRMKPSPSDDAPPPPAVESVSMVVTAGDSQGQGVTAKSTRSARSAPVFANVHQQPVGPSAGVGETSSGGRARSTRSGNVAPLLFMLSYTF